MKIVQLSFQCGSLRPVQIVPHSLCFDQIRPGHLLRRTATTRATQHIVLLPTSGLPVHK